MTNSDQCAKCLSMISTICEWTLYSLQRPRCDVDGPEKTWFDIYQSKFIEIENLLAEMNNQLRELKK